MAHELFAVEHEQVIHLAPDSIVFRNYGVGLERDVGRPASRLNSLHIPMPEKNKAAQELGRLGESKGGKARAANMTPEERSEAARKAVNVRWEKWRRERQQESQ
jgi:hypothetical protein